jgi:pyruvate dehydrogenase E2 component (dihydrolipoamide acetyltransferase)
MPTLGADMDAGTLIEWRIKPGDTVRRGDIVAVVDTDKAAIEVETFDNGVVERLLVEEGTRVPVGTALADIRSEVAPTPPPAPPAPGPPPVPAPTAAPPARPRPLLVSPLIRRHAQQLGVDLAQVTGTGRRGAITRADVDRAAAAAAEQPPAAPVGPAAPPPPPRPAEPARPEAPTRRRPVSPLARRLALQLGVDLAQVTGTGTDGAITQADVERAAAALQRPPAPTEQPVAAGRAVPTAAERQQAMRRAIAALMARSKREIPHYYLGTHIELGRALAWLEAENARRPVARRLLPAVLLLKAVALAIHQVPEMNGFMVDDRFTASQAVHLGVAVSLRQGGLIAPAIRDAEAKDLDQLMADLRDLVTRTRAGVLRSSDMSGPTITVTNLGDRGVETVHGVIYPPQVALVGFGKVTQRPWAQDGMLGVRPVVAATLAADHRVSDGHRGGLFLAAIDRLLQRPEEL